MRPRDEQILLDLGRFGVMTTDQIHRLRYAGTTPSNCRIRLATLRRQGLIARLPRERGRREACWFLTEDGRSRVAQGDEFPAAPCEPVPLLLALSVAEDYVRRRLAERET